MPSRASSVCPLSDEPLHRIELDVHREARDTYFTREILRWLVFSIRPLTLTELRAVLQFNTKIEGLRFYCPDDLESYLKEQLPQTVEVRQIPASISFTQPNGGYAWKTEQRLHAAIATKNIKRSIRSLLNTHQFAFDVKNGHIRLAHVCLKYISMVGQVIDMSEEQKTEACAEFSFMKYSLDAFAIHAATAPRQTLKVFMQSSIFQASCIRSVAHSLLPYAAKTDDIELFDIVLAGVDPNAREGAWQSHTALSHACIKGNMTMVDILLSHPGTNVDLTTHSDMTPLHHAITNEHFDIARLLISKGRANPTLRESHGWNAIFLLFRTTGSKSLLWNHYSELTRTIDTIVSTCPARYELSQRDLEGAAQSGNLEALHYLMDRYRPFITDAQAPSFEECEKGYDEIFTTSSLSTAGVSKPCCLIL